MFKFKEIPGYFVSAFVTAVGAWVTHSHPEWGPYVLSLVACFTHHTGKEVGKSVTSP